MSNNAKDVAGLGSQVDSKQSGFAILMGLLILVLGAAAWYGSIAGGAEKMKAEDSSAPMVELQRIKERMLTYAMLNPEIFDAGLADTSNPGPGYFPCPDITGDGISDTGGNCAGGYSLYGIGWVPQKISKRNFSFLSTSQNIENKRYWFAVDARFMVDGDRFDYLTLSNRFASLNSNLPSLVDSMNVRSACDGTPGNPLTSYCKRPLTLDGKGDIVMILFYAGDDMVKPDKSSARVINFLNINNNNTAKVQIEYYLEQPSMSVPGPAMAGGVFISKGDGVNPFNDHVITITREEWRTAMLSRIARDANKNSIPDLCETPLNVETPSKNSWFDGCRYEKTSPLGGTSPAPPYECTDISTNYWEDDGKGGHRMSSMSSSTITPILNIEGQGWRSVVCEP